jgi:hypothetical protein
MKVATRTAGCIAALLLAGRAHAQDNAPPASASAPAPASAAPSSAAPNMVVLQFSGGKTKGADGTLTPVPAPPAGKGQIVFFRPSATGFLIACTVHEGDAVISHLGNGKYFIHVAEPGVHSYMVESEVKDTIRLEVEPGETYFVKCSIGMGIMMGRPNLTPADKTAFQAKSLKLEKPASTEKSASPDKPAAPDKKSAS